MELLDLPPSGHETRLLSEGVIETSRKCHIRRSVNVGMSAPIRPNGGLILHGHGHDPSQRMGIFANTRDLDVCFPHHDLVHAREVVVATSVVIVDADAAGRRSQHGRRFPDHTREERIWTPRHLPREAMVAQYSMYTQWMVRHSIEDLHAYESPEQPSDVFRAYRIVRDVVAPSLG